MKQTLSWALQSTANQWLRASWRIGIGRMWRWRTTIQWPIHCWWTRLNFKARTHVSWNWFRLQQIYILNKNENSQIVWTKNDRKWMTNWWKLLWNYHYPPWIFQRAELRNALAEFHFQQIAMNPVEKRCSVKKKLHFQIIKFTQNFDKPVKNHHYHCKRHCCYYCWQPMREPYCLPSWQQQRLQPPPMQSTANSC